MLNYIRGHPAAEAAHVARALGMQVPAVRHHLAVLRGDGRVEAMSTRHRAERGRPRLAYRASDAPAHNNLAMLAENLLNMSTEAVPAAPSDPRWLARLGQLLAEQLRSAQPEAGATRRLEALVARLNQLHYDSRWEAGSLGPRLIFGRCPYAAVIVKHPELCVMDREAVSAVMHAEVEQKAKTAPGGEDLACLFALKYV